MAEKICPPQVMTLVEHLRSTGTGQAKLDKITELGKVTKNLDDFLEMLPSNIPQVTLQKVYEFIKRAKDASDKAKGKGSTVTETRNESQSSIPEHTVLVESKAPVLKPEGSNQAKQLGADVEVPKKDAPEEGEGSDDNGESSEVADVNADEAKDVISRMRSTDKLQHIADNDKRKTVKEAAEARLTELKGESE